MENEILLSASDYSDSFPESNEFLRLYELGETVFTYSTVLNTNLNTWRLSRKDKFYIVEGTLCAIPFGNFDVRKWTAEDVVSYLDKYHKITFPINYYQRFDNDKQNFENFIKKDINGEVFLTLTLTDLLGTLKPPRRRQILSIYGAIMILRQYIAINYPESAGTYGAKFPTQSENSFIDDIEPADLCLNSEEYLPVFENELAILRLSAFDTFWITECVVTALPMFGTIDVQKWSVREVIIYLKELIKVSAHIIYSNKNDTEKANMFGQFINEDINGVAFLSLTQRDLLNLIKPPSRRLVLIIYGAILILKKYSEIFHP